MQQRPILEAKNLYKRLDGTAILDNASFCVYPGEILGIVGGNASSKTTLIRVVSGTLPADDGTVMVTSREGTAAPVRCIADARTNGITVLHENIRLYDHFTVAENIFFNAYSGKGKRRCRAGIIHWQALYRQAQELCDRFEFDINVRKRAGTLGYAEKQIVSLLHALQLDTRILIIDDAFSALGHEDIDKVKGIVRRLKETGVAIVALAPSLNHIRDLADSVVFIRDGKTGARLRGDGPEMDWEGKGISAWPEEKPYPKLSVKKGEVHMECRGLSYRNIIRDISFELYHGEILGIVGAAGSGRTTLARVLGGDLRADVGSIYVEGREVTLRHPADARANRISVILDDRKQYGVIPAFSVEDNLIFPNFNNRSTWKRPLFLNHRDCRAYVKNAIEKLAINCGGKGKDIGKLSAGNQQKVLFARALAAQAELFVLDEPTRGIDTAGKVQIYNLLNEAVMIGKSIVFITSDLSEAIGMCDHILVLCEGAVAGEWRRKPHGDLPPEEIYRELYSFFYKDDPPREEEKQEESAGL